MEYQFTKNSLTGDYMVKCSMGHEIVGRWLQEEVNAQLSVIDGILQRLEWMTEGQHHEDKIEGREISVLINRDEVVIQENGIEFEQECAEPDMYLYESESSAACGFEDFVKLVKAWKAFVTSY
ncbi:YacL family protein [Vibrio nigripulchritudo]|uniref:UPF0231 family protein n=1 Tax=Vibrio nigripulchritudo TaxID=28173 RepID=UPI0003B2338A|nr:YacL family protein [Vibrio nigripulchritudo]CCN69060.1 conserved hypothetical protein [Vibrio nigripulchritudo SFn118]